MKRKLAWIKEDGDIFLRNVGLFSIHYTVQGYITFYRYIYILLLEVHRTQVQVRYCGTLHIRGHTFGAVACNSMSSVQERYKFHLHILIWSEVKAKLCVFLTNLTVKWLPRLFHIQKVSVSNLHPDTAFLIGIFRFLFRIFELMLLGPKEGLRITNYHYTIQLQLQKCH